jgi:CRP-like cAMP-binding protein
MGDAHIATLTHCSRYWNQQPGEFLWRQGERADTCFLVLSGQVSLELGVPNEGANRLELLKGGDVLGWSWLLEDGRWHFDARALTAVRGIALDTAKMRALCAKDCPFGYAVLSRCTPLIAERLERTGKLALELLRTAHS